MKYDKKTHKFRLILSLKMVQKLKEDWSWIKLFYKIKYQGGLMNEWKDVNAVSLIAYSNFELHSKTLFLTSGSLKHKFILSMH